MDTERRLLAFEKLGIFLTDFTLAKVPSEKNIGLFNLINEEHSYNPWFTKDNIMLALKSIGGQLQPSKLRFWLDKYPGLSKADKNKRIGVVTAGNIPLVGFHDFISVLVSGNVFIGKLSSKDNRLLKFLANYLIGLDKGFENYIYFAQNELNSFDAIIATGSNNTSRYFHYYFGKYPHIIRKNRNSLAVLTGQESTDDLRKLGIDIFSYFGLGCRNVSKIFVPKDYSFDRLFSAVEGFGNLIQHHKYANNYLYNRSVFLMNGVSFLDNGFVLLKQDERLASPISVVHFDYYNDLHGVKSYIDFNKEQVQCIVSSNEILDGPIMFGNAQQPELWDYADNVDVLGFLLNL